MSAVATNPSAIQNGTSPAAQTREIVPQIAGPRLPFHPAVEERFGIDRAAWKALVEAIFPNASSLESVILALSYCRARKLDPFKRNVHIVPIYDKQRRCMVDTIWPGIGELRTTAFRTGEYAGRDDAKFGPTIEAKLGNTDMKFPEWCQVTVYRMVKGNKVAFAGPKVYWAETYATAKHDVDDPNQMWRERPFGQCEKCAEAAALRAGFPEEIGSDYIAEEVQHSSRVTERVDGLASLPAGRSSFKENALDTNPPAEPAADAEQGQGEAVEGEVIDRKQPEQKQETKPEPKQQADQPRKRWPMNPKSDKVSSVGYWRAQVLKLAQAYATEHKCGDPEQMVQRLEDGERTQAVPRLPGPEDGIQVDDVTPEYRKAKHILEQNPGVWEDVA